MTARRAASTALAAAALTLLATAMITVALGGAAGAQTPTSPPPSTTAPVTAPTTAPTSPPSTAPTSGATAPAAEVDTGTVPGAEDGTAKALLIGGAFIAIIVVGALVARLMARRADGASDQPPAPTDRREDEPPTAPDRRPEEPTQGWADEPAAEPATEPTPRRPLLFDQDQTDGHGWPVTGSSPRERS